MRIKASCGKVSKNVSLCDEIYSLDLRAESYGEKQFLAGLFSTLKTIDQKLKLSDKPPKVIIHVDYHAGGE